jgi:hypothetical protein
MSGINGVTRTYGASPRNPLLCGIHAVSDSIMGRKSFNESYRKCMQAGAGPKKPNGSQYH